jgi:hypothetical protein
MCGLQLYSCRVSDSRDLCQMSQLSAWKLLLLVYCSSVVRLVGAWPRLSHRLERQFYPKSQNLKRRKNSLSHGHLSGSMFLVGRGRFELPTMRPRKGFPRVRRTFSLGRSLTRLNYRPAWRNRRVSLGRLRFRSRLLNLVIHGSLTFYRANR